MDIDKENDAEENNEETDKNVDLDDLSNAENGSNRGYESEDQSETMDWPDEGNSQSADVNDDGESDISAKKNSIDATDLIDGEKRAVDSKLIHPEEGKQTDNDSKLENENSQKDENVNGKKKIREGKPFLKVVIRRLPPSMTKDVFLDQVSPLPSYDYFYFVPASMSPPGSFSRAYINFQNQNDLFDFTRTFDNYVFIDSKGHEYSAIVEFAPYQRVPKVRMGRKRDSLMGTLEADAVYLTFKEQLQAEALENSRTTNKQHYFETEINESEEVVTTPLLEFLKAKRAEKDRIREERREDRKRKEAERKLLKQKIKDKPAQEEEIEIKIVEDSNNSFRSEDSTSSYDDEDLELHERKSYHEEPVIKAILVKPSEKLKKERKLSEHATTNTCSDQVHLKSESSENFIIIPQVDGVSVTSEEKDFTRGYFRGKYYIDSWEPREPGDMYRFSKYRYWERRVRLSGGSGYRYRNANRNNPREQESYCSWSANQLDDPSVLQPPKENKDFSKEKYSKRIKHKDKEDRFVKPENRSVTLVNALVKPENRTREFKNKGGKSYREERLKQAEKREEKKKKEIEEGKEAKYEAIIDEEIKEEEKFFNDKKKWKYGGGGDSKSGRTFSRRRDEKKKEVFERKRGNGKPYRCRKGSGESVDENLKKDKNDSNACEATEKNVPTVVTDKTKEDKESLKSPRKEKSLTAIKQDEPVKKDNASITSQKPIKEKVDENNKEKDHKERKKTEKEDISSSQGIKKDQIFKESYIDSEEGGKSVNKDPRAQRRIRNKDRPSIEIYRPGMGKFSRQRLEKERALGSTDESPSHSPSPTPNNNKNI